MTLDKAQLFESVGEPLAQVEISLEQFDPNANASAVAACGIGNRFQEVLGRFWRLRRAETLDLIDAMTWQRSTSPNRDRDRGTGRAVLIRGDQKSGISVPEHSKPLGTLREWKDDALVLELSLDCLTPGAQPDHSLHLILSLTMMARRSRYGDG